MSKSSGAFSAAILCFGLLLSANIALAGQDPSMPAKDAQKKEKTINISGTVSAVTDSTLTIVDSQKAEHTVAVNGDTKITKGGKDAALTDLKANDVVTIEAKKGADNTWTAVKISVP